MKIFIFCLLVLSCTLTHSASVKRIEKENTGNDLKFEVTSKLEKPKNHSSKIEDFKRPSKKIEDDQNNFKLEDASDLKESNRTKKSCKILSTQTGPTKLCVEISGSPPQVKVCDTDDSSILSSPTTDPNSVSNLAPISPSASSPGYYYPYPQSVPSSQPEYNSIYPSSTGSYQGQNPSYFVPSSTGSNQGQNPTYLVPSSTGSYQGQNPTYFVPSSTGSNQGQNPTYLVPSSTGSYQGQNPTYLVPSSTGSYQGQNPTYLVPSADPNESPISFGLNPSNQFGPNGAGGPIYSITPGSSSIGGLPTQQASSGNAPSGASGAYSPGSFPTVIQTGSTNPKIPPYTSCICSSPSSAANVGPFSSSNVPTATSGSRSELVWDVFWKLAQKLITPAQGPLTLRPPPGTWGYPGSGFASNLGCIIVPSLKARSSLESSEGSAVTPIPKPSLLEPPSDPAAPKLVGLTEIKYPTNSGDINNHGQDVQINPQTAVNENFQATQTSNNWGQVLHQHQGSP